MPALAACETLKRMDFANAKSDSPLSGAMFRTTHWSVVLDAGTDSESGRDALEALCRAYWFPLYSYVRRRGHSAADAEDLTQGFFAQLLEKSGVASAQREKGRFRTFLLTAMQHYLANDWDRANRLKRGGGKEIISWDGIEPESRHQVEPASEGDDTVVFDRQWARAVVGTTLGRLRTEARRDRTEDRFDVLKDFLAGEPPGSSYADVGQKLGLSEGAVKSAIHRLRKRYAQMIREEIGSTVERGQDIEGEIRHLFASLAS